MARRYVKQPQPVADKALADARAAAAVAGERLRAVEHGDPAADGWTAEFEAATTLARATARRVDALEALRAAQVERTGKRAATVAAAAAELDDMAASLSASRSAVESAAVENLRTLAACASAVDAHNAVLARSRDRLAELGLAVRDDLADVSGEDHGEGTLEVGARVGGVDWIPVPAGGIESHSLRLVFAGMGPLHPLAAVGRYVWRSFEVESRADGLRVPGLADAGAVLPAVPVRTVARPAPLAAVMGTPAAGEAAASPRRRGRVA
jgi:hypothetical protein